MKKISILIIFLSFLLAPFSFAQEIIRNIVFPLEGEFQILDNFGDPRGSRTHEGIDILAEKMTPILSASDGQIVYMPQTQPSWGYGIFIKDNEGYGYNYIHMNNDNPGTDDGNGGVQYAYAAGLERGSYVSQGQLIGWVGDSGNAESVGSHLHFEMINPDDIAFDPKPSLEMVLGTSIEDIEKREEFIVTEESFIGYDYDPAYEVQISLSINIDKSITSTGMQSVCSIGTLIKSPDFASVYYCGADGKRYVFPTQKTFDTWYKDFSEVITLTAEQIASIQIGGNVTYRPGVKMIKIQSDPKTYVVSKGGVLRWVPDEKAAFDLYGENWAEMIEDISDAFFTNYTLGDPIIRY